MPPTRRNTAGFALAFALALVLRLAGQPARGAGPADTLLALAPADAAVTVAVENLRGQAAAILGSPVYAGLRSLPVFRDWVDSPAVRAAARAVKRVEQITGEDVATLRDGLLGEAFVLTLRLPPDARPEQARGLLLVRAPDRPLLERTLAALNGAQMRSGELARVSPRKHDGVAYSAREFHPGRRDAEFYTTFGDGTFAWSNSEDLIRGVIDRRTPGPGGLARHPGFRQVRDRLPARAVVSLFVDPRFLSSLSSSAPEPRKNGGKEFMDRLGRYLAAVRYAGAALEWRNGPILHTEESVDPAGLDPGLRRWAARPDRPDPTLTRVPPTALAMATAHVDPAALVEQVEALLTQPGGAKRENLWHAIDGLLLGLDARADVLPRLGPGVVAYLERPEGDGTSGRLPKVIAVELARGDPRSHAAAALANSLKTALALYALDDAHGGGTLRLRSGPGAAGVTALSPAGPFAFALTEGRLTLGTTEGAVARALAAAADPTSSARVESVRSAFFPDAVSFAVADLRAVYGVADGRRRVLARKLAERRKRPEAEATRDMDQALSLINLFDAAFLTTRVDPDLSAVRHRLGLVRVR